MEMAIIGSLAIVLVLLIAILILIWHSVQKLIKYEYYEGEKRKTEEVQTQHKMS
jgi:hypothetical protein